MEGYNLGKLLHGFLFFMNIRANWLDKWSLCVFGNVHRTIVGCLPDWETGIVPNLEVVTLEESFALFQVLLYN